MGTTLEQLEEGAAAIQWVVAIEGYEYLLTDGPTGPAVTAWAATEWTQALSGLTVQGDFKQELDPWQSFKNGGTVTLHVQPDEADTFGIAVHKADPGARTSLLGGMDAVDTSISVKASGQLPAAPGTVYIGTERIEYSAKPNATTVTASARGMYAPFKAGTETEQRFGRYHRQGYAEAADDDTRLETLVSVNPRIWIGRWVGVWMHRKVGTVLDVKAEAQLCFAGKIVEIRDDANTLGTVILLESVLDVIAEAAVGRDFFEGEMPEGILLYQGDRLSLMERRFDGGGERTTSLLAMPGATGTYNATYSRYEVAPGRYTAAELADVFTDWWAEALDIGDLTGRFTMASPTQNINGEVCTDITINIPSSSGNPYWELYFGTDATAIRLKEGLGYRPTVGEIGVNAEMRGTVEPGEDSHYFSPLAPIRYRTSREDAFEFVTTKGAFVDQSDLLPAAARDVIQIDPSLEYGIFLVEGGVYVGAYSPVTSTVSQLRSVPDMQGMASGDTGALHAAVRRYGAGAGPLRAQQVFVLEGRLQDLVPQLLASTGTPGYNHADYDVLPFSLGAAIPWELLGDSFVESLEDLESAAAPLILAIEKPVRIRDLIGADLLIRRSSLVWRNGKLELTSWSTPSTHKAVHSFTEGNKASPGGVTDSERSPTTITDQWQRNLIKIEFNRIAGTDTYRATRKLLDSVSVDDAGGSAKPVEIKLRNTFDGGEAEYIERLVGAFMAWAPYFSKQARLIRRPFPFSMFEGIAPGDICTVSDNFARDPATGMRGMVAVPGIIVGTRHDWGGPAPGNPTSIRPPVGEADVLLAEVDRTTRYSPAMEIDSTYSVGTFTAGYSSTTNQVRIQQKRHGDAGIVGGSFDYEDFANGDEVLIVEIDPDDPDSPQTWTRNISATPGLTVTFNAALTGYDTTKKYRIISVPYGSADAGQRSFAYQADDGDGLIVDTAPPYAFGGGIQRCRTRTTISELPERSASLYAGDGKPLDAGSTRGLILTLNNLVDVATRVHCPMMFSGGGKWVYRYGYGTDTLDFIHQWPIRLGKQLTGAGDGPRYLEVAPQWKTDGAGPTEIMLVLSRTPPNGGPAWITDTDRPFVANTFKEPYSSATWIGTHTTAIVDTSEFLDISVLDENGVGWLTLLGKTYTAGFTPALVYGIPKCWETTLP